MRELTLDTYKRGNAPDPILLREGDFGEPTRLKVYLTNDYMPIVFDEGDQVSFYGTTAAGTKVIDDVPAENMVGQKYFVYDFPLAATSAAGQYEEAYFKFSKADGATTTLNIIVRVMKAVDITASDAADYLSRYDAMLASMLSGASDIDHLVDSAEAIVSSTASYATIASSLASTASDRVDDVVSLANEASLEADNMASASASASSYADATSQFAAVASTLKDSASYDRSVIATLLEAANSNAVQTSAYEVLASTHESNASVYASLAQSLNNQVSTIVDSVSSMNSTIGLYLTAAHDGASMVEDAVYSASSNADVASSIAVIVNSLHSVVSLNASQTASYQSFASNKASTASSFADNASNAAKSASSYAVTASSAAADVLSNSALMELMTPEKLTLQDIALVDDQIDASNIEVTKIGNRITIMGEFSLLTFPNVTRFKMLEFRSNFRSKFQNVFYQGRYNRSTNNYGAEQALLNYTQILINTMNLTVNHAMLINVTYEIIDS